MESEAITASAVLVGGGAALGVVGAAATNNNAFLSSALNGASLGCGLAFLGGLVVALVSKPHREAALETAGIGLVGAIGVGVTRAAAGV